MWEQESRTPQTEPKALTSLTGVRVMDMTAAMLVLFMGGGAYGAHLNQS